MLQEDVEKSLLARNKLSDVESISHDPSGEMLSRMEAETDLARLMDSADPRDNALLQLMAQGEIKTSKFAAVLGIQTLPSSEQRRIVKQHKDRLKARLKRRMKRSDA